MSRRIDALRAMASQDISPNERDIARDKLEAMGAGSDEPPQRPPTAPGPSDESHWWTTTGMTASYNGPAYSNGTFTFIWTNFTENV